MRVLVLTPSYPRYRGDYHGNFIQALCRELAKDHEITVLAPRSRTMNPEPEKFQVKHFPYMPARRMELVAERTLVNAPPSSLIQLPFYMTSAYLHLVKEAPDLVHTHIAIPLGVAQAASPRRVPHVVTCHGSDLTYPLEHPWLVPVTRRTLNSADKVVTVSRYLNRVAERLGVDKEKLETIPTGIDTEKFKPACHSNSKTVIGVLGRLTPQKNIQDIINALPEVNRKIDAELHIAGDGTMEPILKEHVQRLHLDNVFFHGRIREPWRFLQRCDVFALASTREGLSTSLQEAMACGCTPVAVDGYGCPELVTDGVNGFLFKPRDTRSLAQSILKAAHTPGVGLRARETIEEGFDVRKNAVRYTQVYREVVE